MCGLTWLSFPYKKSCMRVVLSVSDYWSDKYHSGQFMSGHWCYNLFFSCKEMPEIKEFEESLNGDRRGLERHIVNIRIQLCVIRCEKSTQYLPTSCQKHLPIVNLANHPVEKLGDTKLFIRVPKQANYYVVSTCKGCPSRPITCKGCPSRQGFWF